MKIIWESANYRIVEHADDDYLIENLEGDLFNPNCHPDIPADQLAQERQDFFDKVSREGVFGYELEKWNPTRGKGWEHVDSCWGFVGSYRKDEDEFNHYIVEEMIGTAGEEEIEP